MRVITANLNGIRSAASKGFFTWLDQQQADAVAVQEVKAQHDQVDDIFSALDPLQGDFHYAQKKGYSGVGLYTQAVPTAVIRGIGVPEFDDEGRWVEKRFDRNGRKLSLISCYFPSGSSGEDRQQAKFRFLAALYPHLMALKAEREFVLLGDVNIAHQEIDLKNYKGNVKNSGFLPEERAWMTRLLTEKRPGGRLSPAASRHHRCLLHLVEQPGPGLRKQRGVAAGLPLGHSRDCSDGQSRGNIQSAEV